MNIVAIDIGMQGAMVCIDVNQRARVVDLQVIKDEDDRFVDGGAIWQQLHEWVPIGMPCLLVAENVRPRPQGNGGRFGNSMHSQGSLMRSRGAVEAAANIARRGGMQMQEVWVYPQTWKRYFGLKREPDDTDADVKEKSRQCALRLFPGFADTALKHKNSHNRAESLLLAHWARSTQL